MTENIQQERDVQSTDGPGEAPAESVQTLLQTIEQSLAEQPARASAERGNAAPPASADEEQRLAALRRELQAKEAELESLHSSLQERERSLTQQQEELERSRDALAEHWRRLQSQQGTSETTQSPGAAPADVGPGGCQQPPPDAAEQSTGEVAELRMRLADVFGFQAGDVETEDDFNDLNEKLANLHPPEEAADQPEPTAPAAQESAAAEDSIDDYWQQLLERARLGDATASALRAPQQPQSQSQPVSAPQPQQSQPSADETSHKPVQREAGGSIFDEPPKHAAQKDALRAGLNDMREISQHSARTAIDRHTSRKLRDTIFLKSVLTTVSGTAAGVLLTAKIWCGVSYDALGWAATSVATVSAVELFRSTLLAHQYKTSRRGSDHDDEEQGN